MDVVSSATAVVGLVFNIATAIKTCNDLRNRFKDASRTVDSIRDELGTLQGALQQLANLMMNDAGALTAQWDSNKSLPTTFDRALQGFKKRIQDLLDDFEPLTRKDSTLGKMEKVKYLWNEDTMMFHIGQLRGQSQALQLLLNVLQTGAVSEVKRALLQLSMSANNGEDILNPMPPAYASQIVEDQPHLLDLDWSENEQMIMSNHRPSIHTEDLLEAFAPARFSVASTLKVEDEYEARRASSVPLIGRTSSQKSPFGAPLNEEKRSLSAFSIHGQDSNVKDVPEEERIAEIAQRMENSNPAALKPSLSDFSLQARHDFSAQPQSHSEVISSPGADGKSDTRNSSPLVSPLQTFDSPDADEVETKQDQSRRIPALIGAIISGDLSQVRNLLDSGCDIESRHPTNKRTGLIFSAMLDHLEILQLLLMRHASVDAKDTVHRTALHYAASEGHRECVGAMLSYGASTSIRDRWNETPLQRGVRYGSMKVCKLMLSSGSDSTDLRTVDGSSILHFAVQNNQPAMVDLICQGLQKAQQTTSYSKVVATIDITDGQGKTSLELAILSENWPICLTLLRHGAQLDDRKAGGIPLLEKAIETLNVSSFADFLTSALENNRNKDFDIPLLSLREAQKLDRWDLIPMILSVVAATPRKHQIKKILDGEKTLMAAISANSEAAVDSILDAGASVDVVLPDTDGLARPLHVAARKSNNRIAELLHDRGADILSPDSKENLPFHYAIAAASCETIEWYYTRTLSDIGAEYKRMTLNSPQAYSKLVQIMYRAVDTVCRYAVTEKMDSVLGLARNTLKVEDHAAFHGYAAAAATAFGRMDATEYFLKRHALLSAQLKKGTLAFSRPFVLTSGEEPPNSIEDHKACKQLALDELSRIRNSIVKKDQSKEMKREKSNENKTLKGRFSLSRSKTAG